LLDSSTNRKQILLIFLFGFKDVYLYIIIINTNVGFVNKNLLFEIKKSELIKESEDSNTREFGNEGFVFINKFICFYQSLLINISPIYQTC
jgi:hypothetical protein